MWWLPLVAWSADPGRRDEPLKVSRYSRIDGDGPVVGRFRNSRGPFLAWHFPDGQIQRLETWEDRARRTTRTFGADGLPEATVDWVARSAVVHFAPPEPVSLEGWGELVVGGVRLSVPAGLASTGPGVWAGGGVVIALQDAADPFADGFVSEVESACRCGVEARRTAWLAAKPGLHLRLQREGQTADLFAIPVADGLLVLSAAGASRAALAPLRAMMAAADEASP